MIKKGDKLIIIAEAMEDENNGTVYVKLTSDSQSNMVMLTENCTVAPVPMEISLHGEIPPQQSILKKVTTKL